MAGSTNHATKGDNCLYLNVTAGTGTIKTGPGVIYGLTANSHSSGTIKLYDDTLQTGQVMFNTISLAATERYVDLGGVTFGTGCAYTVGGTADLTIHYK